MRDYRARVSVPARDDLGAAIVALLDEAERFVLVNEIGGDKPPPYFWKFPGGRIERRDQNPTAAAIREVKEETGIAVPPDRIAQVGVIRKHTHDVYVFAALVSSFDGLKKFGDEGEVVGVFSLPDVEKMEKDGSFLRAHTTIKNMVVAFANR